MVLTTIYGAAPSDVQLWPFKVLSGAKGEPEFDVQFMKERAGRFHLDGISFIVHGTTMEATTTDFHGFEVMTMVRRLAKEEHQGKIGFCFADKGTVREDWSQQLLWSHKEFRLHFVHRQLEQRWHQGTQLPRSCCEDFREGVASVRMQRRCANRS